MPGIMLAVSGLSGAGKSTLVAALLQSRPDLSYLRTITTRQMRAGEEHSHEYEFVSLEEYNRRKQGSARWDETQYQDNYYGADAGKSIEQLAKGTNVICSIAPSQAILEQMEQVYQTKLVTIWVDTPSQVAQQRIKDDAQRRARQEDSALKSNFDHIFKPTGNLEADKDAFISLVADIL
jgi:guanylate kinase